MATAEPTLEEVVSDIAPAVSSGGKYALMAAGVIFGASVSYLATKYYLERKYADMAEREIEEIRELYFEKKRQEKNGGETLNVQKPNLTKLMEDLEYRQAEREQEIINGPEPMVVPPDEPVQEDNDVVLRNTFEAESSWNWEAENSLRESLDPGVPYVIHRDEFFNNENNWDQAHYTYYEKDDILADDHDAPADDQDALVGLVNLTKFGHGSFDPNVVYVRNPELEIEIAVVCTDESFQKDQHGDDDQPPSDPRKRRSRGGQ